MSPTVTSRSAEMYSCRATGPASCRTMFLLSQDKTDSEKKDQQIKSKVYISLHYWGHSFTNSFSGLAGRTTERCHPACCCSWPLFPSMSVTGCIFADMQWTQLRNWHGSKLNFPTPTPLKQFSITSVPGSRSLHGSNNTCAGVREKKSENRNKTNDFLQWHQLVSPPCVHETVVWPSIALPCTTPYTVCSKH